MRSMVTGLVLLFAVFVSLPTHGQLEAWRRQASPVEDDLHNAFFLNGETGWILAHQSGAILHTTDGGETWTVRATLDRGFREAIFFANATTGWVCGEGGRIARTDDGGSTWKETSPGGKGVALGSLYMTDAERGFALGGDLESLKPAVLATDDGGRTWQRREDETSGRGFTDALASLATGNAVAGGFQAVYRTRDGGATWQSTDVDTTAVRGLFFLDDQRGWAVGHDGFVARTDDGGQRWQPMVPVSRALLRSVLFTDDQRGYLVGDLGQRGGVLYATDDGGQRWRREGGPYPGLHRLARGGDRVWIVGKDGTILVHDIEPTPTMPGNDVEPAPGEPSESE